MIIVEKGESPLILCLPHAGIDIPPAVEARLSATGRLQADISWRLEQVVESARELGATIIRSSISRYVIDVDRDCDAEQDPEGSPRELLCPFFTLDLKSIYKSGEEPGPVEIDQRKLLFYVPFHRALEQEIGRLRKLHDQVVLFDCQSVRSRIRGFLESELPVINLGTAEGNACFETLKDAFAAPFVEQNGFSVATDEVFKGGHIIRRYGDPKRGLQALTVVIAQRAYLRHESPPFEPDKARISRLKTALAAGLTSVIEWTSQPVAEQQEIGSVDAVAQPEWTDDSGNAPELPPLAEDDEELFASGLPSAP
jgi:N-formylglutamate deformylase